MGNRLTSSSKREEKESQKLTTVKRGGMARVDLEQWRGRDERKVSEIERRRKQKTSGVR